MPHIQRRSGVDDDIFELAAYLAKQSHEVARRFVDAVQHTLMELARRPGIGSPKGMTEPGLTEVRTWWVEGFRNHLVYYIALPDGIDVLAVLHGARDAPAILRDRAS